MITSFSALYMASLQGVEMEKSRSEWKSTERQRDGRYWRRGGGIRRKSVGAAPVPRHTSAPVWKRIPHGIFRQRKPSCPKILCLFPSAKGYIQSLEKGLQVSNLQYIFCQHSIHSSVVVGELFVQSHALLNGPLNSGDLAHWQQNKLLELRLLHNPNEFKKFSCLKTLVFFTRSFHWPFWLNEEQLAFVVNCQSKPVVTRNRNQHEQSAQVQMASLTHRCTLKA